jgi:hypothetical protein
VEHIMTIEIISHGNVPEEQLHELERHLGARLPDDYRRWLAATNGGEPAGRAVIDGLNFTWQQRAYGFRPDTPLRDVLHNSTYFRDRSATVPSPASPAASSPSSYAATLPARFGSGTTTTHAAVGTVPRKSSRC